MEPPEGMYAAWLDEETCRPDTSGKERLPSVLARERVAWIKFNWLWGNTIDLIDVQLVDSWPVLELFADSQFRGVLPRILQLNLLRLTGRAGRPASLEEQRFKIATGGIARALRTDSDGQYTWSSSTFPTPPSPSKIGTAWTGDARFAC